MGNNFFYRGYAGSCEYSASDDVYYGKLLSIEDLITYEAESPEKLVTAFEEEVDAYISFSTELG